VNSLSELKPTRTLDCIGLFCPIPVFQTRQALDKLSKGEILEVMADDPAAEGDIQSLAKRLTVTILKIEKEEGKVRIFLQK
jgi:TusA-related sulfurtransferase